MESFDHGILQILGKWGGESNLGGVIVYLTPPPEIQRNKARIKQQKLYIRRFWISKPFK